MRRYSTACGCRRWGYDLQILPNFIGVKVLSLLLKNHSIFLANLSGVICLLKKTVNKSVAGCRRLFGRAGRLAACAVVLICHNYVLLFLAAVEHRSHFWEREWTARCSRIGKASAGWKNRSGKRSDEGQCRRVTIAAGQGLPMQLRRRPAARR